MLSSSAAAVGNPPIFYVGAAGPYALRVSIHPPDVIPGLAKLEIESDEPDLQRVRLVALPLDSAQAAFPPTPDRAERSASNPRQLVGQLWLMSSGSWQVRILADGARGPGELSIPVPALPTHVARMPPDLGALLLGLLLILALGLISIVSAAVREGQLAPGEQPGRLQLRRGRTAVLVASGIVLALVLLGGRWWAVTARAYGRSVYRPLSLSTELADGQLRLTLEDPGWLPSRTLDDLVAPEGHPLDLWVLALPDLDRVWHLHPAQTGPGQFQHTLPAMPAGRYARCSPASCTRMAWRKPRIGRGPDPCRQPAERSRPATRGAWVARSAAAEALVAALPNGGRLSLEPDGLLKAGQPSRLRFRVLNRQGQPEREIEPVGRLAEATIVSGGLESFSRLSTRGTVSQASWAIANPGVHEAAQVPTPDLAFNYEFPRPGRYRVFVQLRIAGQNEIAILDVRVL